MDAFRRAHYAPHLLAARGYEMRHGIAIELPVSRWARDRPMPHVAPRSDDHWHLRLARSPDVFRILLATETVEDLGRQFANLAHCFVRAISPGSAGHDAAHLHAAALQVLAIGPPFP